MGKGDRGRRGDTEWTKCGGGGSTVCFRVEVHGDPREAGDKDTGHCRGGNVPAKTEGSRRGRGARRTRQLGAGERAWLVPLVSMAHRAVPLCGQGQASQRRACPLALLTLKEEKPQGRLTFTHSDDFWDS